MTGDERTRFCSTCGLHVHNLSVLTADERASLRRNTAGRLCVTYQRRLNGAFVSPDQPLTARESTHLRQVGAVALSAAALALAAGCVARPESVVPSAPEVTAASTPAAAPDPKQDEEEVIMLRGRSTADTPPPSAPPNPATAPTPASPDNEEVIVLTGFFVETSEDTAGYNAVEVLAGTRIDVSRPPPHQSKRP